MNNILLYCRNQTHHKLIGTNRATIATETNPIIEYFISWIKKEEDWYKGNIRSEIQHKKIALKYIGDGLKEPTGYIADPNKASDAYVVQLHCIRFVVVKITVVDAKCNKNLHIQYNIKY